MKCSLFIYLSVFVMNYSFAQSLEGEWNGSVKDKTEAISIPATPFSLKFLLNNDSTYSVYSYTQTSYYEKKKERYDTTVCFVKIERHTADSIFLEETKIIDPKADTSGCYIKLKLKIILSQEDSLLNGTWEVVQQRKPGSKEVFLNDAWLVMQENCSGWGYIEFIKRKRR